MFKLDEGSLSMDNYDLEHIKGRIDEDNCSAKEALQIELEISGIDIKNVESIELNGSQLKNNGYCDIYSRIVCCFWSNN